MCGQSRVNEMNTLPIYYNIRHVNCHTLRDGQQIFHISSEAILFCCLSDVFLTRPGRGHSPIRLHLTVNWPCCQIRRQGRPFWRQMSQAVGGGLGWPGLVTIFSPGDCCGNTRAPEQARCDGWGWSLLVACLHLVITSRGIKIKTDSLDCYKYVIILVNFFWNLPRNAASWH